MSHIAGSHLESGIGESSKMVPCFALNCLAQPLALHFQSWRVARNEVALPWHLGQVGSPSGQRRAATKAKATSGAAKYWTAWSRVWGASACGLIACPGICCRGFQGQLAALDGACLLSLSGNSA